MSGIVTEFPMDMFRPSPRPGELAGVKITCEGERNLGYFIPVSVPASDPIFIDNVLAPISARIGTPLLLRRIPTVNPDMKGSLENAAAASFMLDPATGLYPPKWESNVGTILFVRQDQKPLTAKHLEAMWMFHDRLITTFRFADNATQTAKLLMTPEKWAFYWTGYSRNQENLLRQLGQRKEDSEGWANAKSPFDI